MTHAPTSHEPAPRTSGLAVAALIAAIVVSMVLATLGYFLVGFGMMTDCTNNYSCTETGCPPCEGTSRWLGAGAALQVVLALAAAVLLWRGSRSPRLRKHLGAAGASLIVLSMAVVVLTTRAAENSYCRPGTPGYAASYCDT